MFFIFKIVPDWFWLMLLIAGLSSYFLSYLSPVKAYALLLKISGCMVIALSIFIFGMIYCDRVWQQAAQTLEDKVLLMESKSAQVTETAKEKVIVKTQIIHQRGINTVEYIDREVAKTDVACVVSPEFVQAHNSAAEPPK